MLEYELKNHLKLYYYPIQNSYSVSIAMLVKCGSINESKSKLGITHLLEHMHFRRIGEMTQDEIYYKTECKGGALCAATYRDALRFNMKISPKHLSCAIKFFRDIITTYNWSQDELDAEKRLS